MQRRTPVVVSRVDDRAGLVGGEEFLHLGDVAGADGFVDFSVRKGKG